MEECIKHFTCMHIYGVTFACGAPETLDICGSLAGICPRKGVCVCGGGGGGHKKSCCCSF